MMNKVVVPVCDNAHLNREPWLHVEMA